MRGLSSQHQSSSVPQEKFPVSHVFHMVWLHNSIYPCLLLVNHSLSVCAAPWAVTGTLSGDSLPQFVVIQFGMLVPAVLWQLVCCAYCTAYIASSASIQQPAWHVWHAQTEMSTNRLAFGFGFVCEGHYGNMRVPQPCPNCLVAAASLQPACMCVTLTATEHNGPACVSPSQQQHQVLSTQFALAASGPSSCVQHSDAIIIVQCQPTQQVA